MGINDVRTIVVEKLAEQGRIPSREIDAIVLKTIVTVLTSFGIKEDAPRIAGRFRPAAAVAKKR